MRFFADITLLKTGKVESVSWNFGDNTTATGSSVQKTYSALGTNTVVMTVQYQLVNAAGTAYTGVTNSLSRTNEAFITVVPSVGNLSLGRAYRRGFPSAYGWEDIIKAYGTPSASGDTYSYYRYLETAHSDFTFQANPSTTTNLTLGRQLLAETVNELLQGQTLVANQRLIEALRIKYPRIDNLDPANPPPKLPEPPGAREETLAIDVSLLDYQSALYWAFKSVGDFGLDILRPRAPAGTEPFPDFPAYLTFADVTLSPQPMPIKNEYWQLTWALDRLAFGTVAKANKLFNLSLADISAPAESKEACKKAGIAGYLGMAVLASGQSTNDFALNHGNSLLAHVKNARDLFENINAGLNPLRNNGEFIPNESFGNIYAAAQEAVSDARAAEIEMRQETREFDRRKAELRSELQSQRAQFITPLKNLTGLDPAGYNNLATVADQIDYRGTVSQRVNALLAAYPNADPKGVGEYGAQVIAVLDAGEAIKQAVNRLNNLYESIKISEWANTEVRIANESATRQLKVNDIARGFANSVSFSTSAPFHVSISPGSIVSGFLNADDRDIQRIQQAQISNIQLQEQIRKSLLEVANLAIDIRRAKNHYDQEKLKLDSMLSLMDRYIEDLAHARLTAENLYFQDPSFRVVVSSAQRRADGELDFAIDRLFRLAKTLEYEWTEPYQNPVTVPIGSQETPSLENPLFDKFTSLESLFVVSSADESKDYLDALRARNSKLRRITVASVRGPNHAGPITAEPISVRENILNLKTTGVGAMTLDKSVSAFRDYVQDLSGEEHTSYDARGRVEHVIKRLPDPVFLSTLNLQPSTSLVSYRTAFAYDSLDRVTTLTYPDSDVVGYLYNARNLLTRITGGPSGSIITNIAYRASDQLTQIDYGNNVRTTYDYDPRLRLNQLRTRNQEQGTELLNFSYEFDGVSNIKAIRDQRPGAAVPGGDKRRNTQLFQYDDLYRITRAQYSFALPGAADANNGSITYRYDRIGNMMNQSSDIVHNDRGVSVTDLGNMSYGGTTGRMGRIGRINAEPGPHALSSISNPLSPIPNRLFPYDANGNMTVIDGLTNTWDFKDRLIQVEDTNMVARYTYDYTDRRVAKRVTWKTASTNNLTGLTNNSVLYPDKYFEVREADAPVKYVWNGNTRVARVTGSLTTSQRTQRLRVYPGFNMVSLAVNLVAADVRRLILSDQSLVTSAATVLGVQRWNSAGFAWVTVTTNDALPAGTVLWLRMSTNTTLSLTGTYAEPANQTLQPGATFIAGWGLQPLPLSPISYSPFPASLWAYNNQSKTWRKRLTGELQTLSDVPAMLAPGDAVFARPEVVSTLTVPESALAVRYYHQDHLGSSSVLTDAAGTLVSETANYAFGFARNEFLPRNLREPYGFTQKEKDYESSLGYFEARFLASNLNRFLSFDPLLFCSDEEEDDDEDDSDVSEAEHILEPKRLNPYIYALNNPVVLSDPSGRAAQVPIAAGLCLAGAAGKLASQAAGDAIAYLATGQKPSVCNYPAAAAGGCAGGAAMTLTLNPYVAATATGVVGGAVKQGCKKLTGQQTSGGEFIADVATELVGEAAKRGASKVLKRALDQKGSGGSSTAIRKQMETKAREGVSKRMTAKTTLKIVGGKTGDAIKNAPISAAIKTGKKAVLTAAQNKSSNSDQNTKSGSNSDAIRKEMKWGGKY